MNRLLALCLVTSLLYLAGCGSGTRIRSDFDPTTDFSALNTFDWAPGGNEKSVYHFHIRTTVEKILMEKGYDKVAEGETPDFLITYYTDARTITDVRTDYSYWRGSPWGGNVDVYQYDEGTLILDVVEPGDNELAWRGSAVATVGDPSRVEQKIVDVLVEMLDDFPPE